MHTIISFLMAVMPSLLLVWYYYRRHKKKPGPKRLIVTVFLLGILYVVPVYGLEQIIAHANAYYSVSPLLYYFFESFIVAGLCEEYIKLRIVKRYVYNSVHFTEVFDGILYTIVAGLGFACMENVLYVINGTVHTALTRGFTAVPMHAVCAGVLGYYIGLAKCAGTKEKERRLISEGLWKAVFIHGLYDFFLFLSPLYGSVFSVLVVPLIATTYIKLRATISKTIQESGGSSRPAVG